MNDAFWQSQTLLVYAVNGQYCIRQRRDQAIFFNIVGLKNDVLQHLLKKGYFFDRTEDYFGVVVTSWNYEPEETATMLSDDDFKSIITNNARRFPPTLHCVVVVENDHNLVIIFPMHSRLGFQTSKDANGTIVQRVLQEGFFLRSIVETPLGKYWKCDKNFPEALPEAVLLYEARNLRLDTSSTYSVDLS